MEIKEENPLKWPDGQARTRIQDRKAQSSWKKKTHEYQNLMLSELKKLGATSVLITINKFPESERDPGVAVYLSMKQVDYSWQEALGFVGELPSAQDIHRAYMERAKKVHPECQTPNVELFMQLTKQRDQALRFIRGEHLTEHDKVIAVDVFKEVRLNMNAIRLVLGAMRQFERCGAPMMMERAWRGFSKMITSGGGNATTVA